MSDRELPLPETVPAEEMEEGQVREGPAEWSAVDHYLLLSVPITVRSLWEPFSDALRWHLAPFHREEAAPIAGTVIEVWPRVEDESDWSTGAWRNAETIVYARDGKVERIAAPASVLEYALWQANAIVPQLARDFLFLHAGAVSRDGKGLLIPALMDAGKSTLVTALLASGHAYLSDELGAIDPVTSRLYPYEKLISLDAAAVGFFPDLAGRLLDRGALSGELRQRFVRPQDLGASVSGPVLARWIVFLEPDREGPPRLEALPHSAAVPRMVTHCFNLDRFGDRGIVLLSRVAAEAEAFVLRGGSPGERAELLAERLT